MASPFESFIQLELPKRPYLEQDVPEESVIIRRGAGPRQLQGLSLEDGQFLGAEGGQIKGLYPGGGSNDGLIHTQAAASATWTINHAKNSTNVVITILDADGHKILCDDVHVQPNTIVLTFAEDQAGSVSVVFI